MGGVFDRPLHGLVLTEAEFETDEQAHSRRWPGLRSSPRSPVFPGTRGVPGNTAGLPPLAVILTPGQAGDNPELLPLLDDIHDINVDGQRVRVGRVIADKAYTHPSTRSALRRRRIKAHHPGTRRPDRPPQSQGFGRRQSTGLRPRSLQALSRG
jgi:transposase